MRFVKTNKQKRPLSGLFSFYNLLHFSPLCLFFPLHVFLLEIYPSTCTSTLYAKLFLSSHHPNDCYKGEKNHDDIHILLAPLLSLSYSILLLQGHDLTCIPCLKTPVCNVMYYNTHVAAGDPCPEENDKQTKGGQDRKGETQSQPAPPHFCFHSTVSSCAKSWIIKLF